MLELVRTLVTNTNASLEKRTKQKTKQKKGGGEEGGENFAQIHSDVKSYSA